MMYGMRNRLAHDYGGVEMGVVYQVATVHLPVLVTHLREALEVLTAEYHPGSD